MILTSVFSKNNVSIRLTSERWQHIITSHLEINNKDYQKIIKVVGNPDYILKGDVGELLAVKKLGKKIWIVVPYKEVSQDDGFVLTAYLTTDDTWLFKRKLIWNKE